MTPVGINRASGALAPLRGDENGEWRDFARALTYQQGAQLTLSGMFASIQMFWGHITQR